MAMKNTIQNKRNTALCIMNGIICNVSTAAFGIRCTHVLQRGGQKREGGDGGGGTVLGREEGGWRVREAQQPAWLVREKERARVRKVWVYRQVTNLRWA